MPRKKKTQTNSKESVVRETRMTRSKQIQKLNHTLDLNAESKKTPTKRRKNNKNKNDSENYVLDNIQSIELETIETEVITSDTCMQTTDSMVPNSDDTHNIDIPHVTQSKQTDCNSGQNAIVAKKSLPEPVMNCADNDSLSEIVLEEMCSESEINTEPSPKKKQKRIFKSRESIPDSEQQTNNKSLPCLDCGLEFADMHALVVHEVTAHEDKGFRCHVCDKVFTRKYHLDRHLQLTPCSGQPPPAHPCEVCGKVYTRKDNLREHLRVHAGEVTRKKKFKCEHCPKMFHGASLLRIHVRTHTGEKPFKCDFCPKAFPSGGALTKHRRIHTGEKPYNCPECEIRFSLKGTLNRHMRIHTGIRPHKCPYCGKQFIQAGGLKAHLFYHTGQNGFKCEFCGKIFNRKARLQMHTRYVHEKDRPFECTDCGKRFTRKEDLNRHFVLHTGEKPHQCPTCLKRFSIKPSLKLHLLTHTKEEPRSCHECGRAFIRKDCLLRHMRKRHRDLLDKILMEEKDDDVSGNASNSPGSSGYAVNNRVLSEQKLCDSIRELLSLLVDETTLKGFGWPDAPVDELLEAVIKRCGHTPVKHENYTYYDRLRENSKLLFTVVIDDNAVKTLLNNQTVDEVILHVLRLAKS